VGLLNLREWRKDALRSAIAQERAPLHRARHRAD
jgi:hypothetical protein